MKADTEPLTTLPDNSFVQWIADNGPQPGNVGWERNFPRHGDHSIGDTIWQYSATERCKEAEEEMLGFRSHQTQRSGYC